MVLWLTTNSQSIGEFCSTNYQSCKTAERTARKHSIKSDRQKGTSIGNNICEAKYAYCTADFIPKMQFALKEANETGYWLELLYKTNDIVEEQYHLFESKCKSLRAQHRKGECQMKYIRLPIS